MAQGKWLKHDWTADRIDRLARAAGGTGKLAAILNVHETTVSRWRHGKALPPSTKHGALEALERAHALTPR